MPKRTDIDTILVIGAGPIVIGQACEFDYSGTQACLALKRENYRVVLINPNPASIMTDPEVADVTYIEPITPEILEKIIVIEKPQAILPTMGGQTSLNAAMHLHHSGILSRYNIELIGANADVIQAAEDREQFRKHMEQNGLRCPKSFVVNTKEQATKVLDSLSLPLVIRPSFTLGGTGGGIAKNRGQFESIVEQGLSASMDSSILIEEYLDGWKEFEMEVVRDSKDNCIIVCSIENVDPMGVHTGDSITVAPIQTLTDKEYQVMRDASFQVMRIIGVDTGGANVQFAVNPANGEMLVIEMNPRVSRSSALASKATGYPIAKIAALLAVGYTLDELKNDITEITPASFEPTIDYVVTKIPCFAFEKFDMSDDTLTTTMRSVGEVMAIGRNFSESLQKAIRSLEQGFYGLDNFTQANSSHEDILRNISRPHPNRLFQVAQALRQGIDVDTVHHACRIDRWFLNEIAGIIACENALKEPGAYQNLNMLAEAKSRGLSDRQIARLSDVTESKVKETRVALSIKTRYRCVDTCAGEIKALTRYLYGHYPTPQAVLGGVESHYSNEWKPLSGKKIVIIGSGPNRIGQGIEFDYCCVHAAKGLQKAGYKVVMINCNPETVSTDYDVSDRLYFEPIYDEDVLNIIEAEQQDGNLLGVFLQFGGQSPLKLAGTLDKHGIPILGTAFSSIDIAEDRRKCHQLLESLNLKQPNGETATSRDEAIACANRLGFPVMVRPSYVLGGRAMRIIYSQSELTDHIDQALHFSEQAPLLIDSYLQTAIEVDCDLIADGSDVWIAGIMEHIEEAGIHSGDSACSLPPYSLKSNIISTIGHAAKLVAKSLRIKGMLNIQFAVHEEDVYILEINPRASRTLPFVAKATGIPVAEIAARVMAGEAIASFNLKDNLANSMGYFAVKEAVFPFARFPDSDVRLGPEMRSTGEVMGLADDFPVAYAKAQIGAGVNLPTSGEVFISVINDDKDFFIPLAQRLLSMDFKLVATRGTALALVQADLPVEIVAKHQEHGRSIIDKLLDKEIVMMLNTSQGRRSVHDSFMMRKLAIANNIPYVSTRNAASATVDALEVLRKDPLLVCSLQNYILRFKELADGKNTDHSSGNGPFAVRTETAS